MAEKTIVVDIDIKAEDIRAANDAMAQAAKSSAEYTKQLNDLKAQQKEANALYKSGAIDATENAKRQSALKIQMTEVSKSLRESNKEYTNNKTVVDAAKGSNEQLRARLSLLTKQYNGLSKEQRENSKTGKQMEATIKTITDKLKANEKAVGDNRRNVGNYEEALKGVAGQINVMGVNLGGLANQLKTYKEGVIASTAATKASATGTGLFSTALNVLKLAIIGTGIGALVIALGSLVTFFTQTKRGAELLAQGLSAIGATVSVLTDRMSQLGEALTMVFDGEFTKAAEQAKGAFGGITEEIVKESKAAANLEKQMQKLRDRERDLTVEISKRKAEVAALQLLAEDETKSNAVRLEAIRKANAIQLDQQEKELALQREKVRITEEQLALGENLEEDENRLAQERAKLGEIEAANLKKLRTLKAKENSIVKQEQAQLIKRENEKRKLTEEQIKAEEERLKQIEIGYQEERALIDQQTELKKSQAIINIANAEQQAEAIAFIEKEALLEKLRSIEDETVAYTASADAIGAVDEEKYAKQLAERAKYEAELAAIDRAAKAKAFTEEVDYLAKQEQLEIENAEFSIQNADDLEKKKAEISLKYLELKLKLMRENAMLDGVLTKQEIQNLQLVENQIKRMINLIKNGDGEGEKNPTIADMLGLSDEDLQEIQSGISSVTQVLQSVQALVSANAEKRIQEIETQNQYEIQAIENSAISEEEKDAKIQALNKKAAQEKYKIEVEQFKTAKALQIALAVANTATAVMAQLSNPTPYVGFVLAALAAATGAIQIGTIASQKPPAPPKFATGGYVSGAGTGTSDSIDAKLSNGESVINAKSTAKYEPLLSAINADGGGVDWYNSKSILNGNAFARGGIASPTFAARQATNSNTQALEAQIIQLGDRIETMQPVVRVTDINRINRQSVKVQQSADL